MKVHLGRKIRIDADELADLLARRRSGALAIGLGSGILLGAASLWLLDTGAGRRRRHVLFDKLRHFERRSATGLQKSGRDLMHRARGMVAETSHKLRDESVSDDVLGERVRSKIGRVISHPSAIEVTAQEGHIMLKGPVLADELEALLRAVKRVRGVDSVENRLQAYQTPGVIPALQGPTRRPGTRFELFQENWSPAARLLVGLTGGAMLAEGARRGGIVGGLCALVGGAGCARAATNHPMRRILGIGAGRRAIDFQKTIYINAPVEAVFTYFRELENFPRFMTHLRDVRVSDDGRLTHWVAVGPGGVPVEWDAEMTALEENRRIAWRSLPGSAVENAGTVQFEPAPDGGTRLTVRLSYNPPAGALGHVVASLFAKDPKHAMDDDLLRFKSLMEIGKARGRGEQIRRDDLPHGEMPLPH